MQIPDDESTDAPVPMRLYSIYYEHIKHENELVNHRNTWLLATQGVLFAGLAIVFQSGFEVVVATMLQQAGAHASTTLKYFIMWFAVCIAGLVTANHSIKSIGLAHAAQGALEVLWKNNSSEELRAVLPDLRGGKDGPPPIGHGTGGGMARLYLIFWGIAIAAGGATLILGAVVRIH